MRSYTLLLLFTKDGVLREWVSAGRPWMCGHCCIAGYLSAKQQKGCFLRSKKFMQTTCCQTYATITNSVVVVSVRHAKSEPSACGHAGRIVLIQDMLTGSPMRLRGSLSQTEFRAYNGAKLIVISNVV